MKSFDALFYGGTQSGSTGFPVIDTVVIENQISPIANRMKTVQGMITQYFLMRGVDKRQIIYFSAVQKLKVAPYHFVFYNNTHGPNHSAVDDADADIVDDIQTYDERFLQVLCLVVQHRRQRWQRRQVQEPRNYFQLRHQVLVQI